MSAKPRAHPYDGLTVVIGTRHGKGALMEPALAAHCGLRVEEVAVDTDALGTFAGESPRMVTPVEAARAKAWAAVTAVGSRLGLGSEGTFGPDQIAAWTAIDTELVLILDAELGTEVSAVVRSADLRHQLAAVSESMALDELMARFDAPRHRLIVRPAGVSPMTASEQGLLFKGVAEPEDLALAITRCTAASPEHRAHVEHDLRAHCSPSRQLVIRKAAERLAQRLAHLCPDCGAPGWGVVGHVGGLPCAACGSHDTTALRARLLGCPRCQHTDSEPVAATTTDPQWCAVCNP